MSDYLLERPKCSNMDKTINLATSTQSMMFQVVIPMERI